MARLDYAYVRSEMANIPRGVGAPPPPGMNSSKRGRLVCIKVRMLDDTVAVFHLGHKAAGQTLFDEVCRHLNLLESDYFGLSYVDACGNHCWLDREKTILRQITSGSSDAKFYFIVKFYTPNPIDLEEEYTRYLFTLQIKRDLAYGELHCAESTAALLSAYLVQSECGDFSAEDYPDATYLSHTRYVPNQTIEFQKKVMENHRNLIGMSPGESDLAMLEVARRCDFYGVKLHAAKDVDNNEAALSVMHLGMKVFRQLQLDTTFSWARIRKLSFKRKKLLIKLHPDSYQYLKETVEFVFETRDECKNFWKKCVEHHAFFRCLLSEEPKKRFQVFFISKGSSFRYHGRTQKQLIDYVREHHKRREPFTRPLRSAISTRGLGYSSTYSTVGEKQRQRNGTAGNNTHASLPHIPHYSHADPTSSGTLDARVGTTTSSRPRQLKRSERCTSDVESSNRPRHHESSKEPEIVPPSHNNIDLSVSLPNVLSDDLRVACKELELETKEPPKSVSGDNFQELRTSREYDNISEDSYRLSDHERSTRSDAGVGTKRTVVTTFNSTFAARRDGNTVVKRVISQSKSTPNSTDDEESILKPASDYHTYRAVKEYPFSRATNIVPIEIDGPNVDLSARRALLTSSTSTTTTTTTQVLTTSGAVLVKPKVLSTDLNIYERIAVKPASTENQGTYGAIGPLPGKVITKENMVITPDGVKEKKTKPIPPPKPNLKSLTPEAPSKEITHPLVHMVDEDVQQTPAAPPAHEERKSSLSRPALISVQSEDNPEIQKCHLFNSDIPYTLTMRNVESTQSLPFSTFKDVRRDYDSSSLKRVSKSPEFKRRKSLDLVPRKRLPSPGNFSAQDHTISPTTPDSDVLEYLLRRRSLSQERSALVKSRSKRSDPRRQTQPVRFDLPPSPCSPTAGGSTPFISLLTDEVFDECVSESRSLHEDMDRLDKSTPHTQSICSFNEKRCESEESDAMPPPPEEVLINQVIAKKSRPQPPPPPPKPLSLATKVAGMKSAAAPNNNNPEPFRQRNSTSDSPPFIDDSPKTAEGASLSASMHLEGDHVESYVIPVLEEVPIIRKPEPKPQVTFNSIVRELYWKETTFARDLLLISKGLYERLEDHFKSCKLLQEFFKTLNEVEITHAPLLEVLKKTSEETSWGTVTSAILCAVHNLIPLYQSLSQQYPIYISAIDQLSRSKATFRVELQKFENSDECYIPVNWLLLKIINRLMNWQPVLARLIELLLADANSENELTSLRVAMDKIIELSEKTKNSRAALEEYVSTLQLERDIGMIGVLCNPNRQILRFGVVSRWSQRGPCYRVMILCTDRILFAHRIHSADGNSFSVHAEVKLKGLMIDEGDTYNVMSDEKGVITLHSADKSIVFSTTDRSVWMEDITAAVKGAARAKIDLPSIVMDRREDSDIEGAKSSFYEDIHTSKLSPLLICWHRKCSFGLRDINNMISNAMSGYLLRKLRNSSGWQKLWVVLSCHSLIFYKNHEENSPLASLSLLDYGIGLPSVNDNVTHQNCFKLFYGSHQYFFRADTYYFFERWVESILKAAISKNSLDVVTALALRI
ncbi:unnamed protein product [Caenorhabditis auriculariae]|uniref:Moesin/ezrin/radixin homolog 1 n=1 Tax=Caenorhabditis auriculariae TaxID=2777116 RepID=A0A8S1GX74_9PELO|nr:unnamed protein product [Caenorhabditis auriculariae]